MRGAPVEPITNRVTRHLLVHKPATLVHQQPAIFGSRAQAALILTSGHGSGAPPKIGSTYGGELGFEALACHARTSHGSKRVMLMLRANGSASRYLGMMF